MNPISKYQAFYEKRMLSSTLIHKKNNNKIKKAQKSISLFFVN